MFFVSLLLATTLSTAIDSTVNSQLGKSGVPGAAVAIISRGSMAYERGFGSRAIGDGLVTPQTRFQIGSDTKQFTASAILQLREKGKLGLDDPLAKYVPTFPHASEITIRQLLEQVSGLPDFVMTNHFVQTAQRTTGSFEKIVAMIDGPLHFKPGSKWEYSNTNYVVLGRVIEVVSGQSYHAYVRQHLFGVAGMLESTFISNQASVREMATGYWNGVSRHEPLKPAPNIGDSWFGAAGDIISTVDDLAKWDRALQSGKVVSTNDFRLMTSPGRLIDGSLDDYGFGWWIDPVAGHTDIYHDGDTLGMSSSNNLFPDDELQIIVLENEGNDTAAKTARAVFETILSECAKDKDRAANGLSLPFILNQSAGYGIVMGPRSTCWI